MDTRRRLLFPTVALLIVGLAVVVAVLASSLEPSAQTKNDADVLIHLAPIVPGELQTFNVKGRPLFVLRPNQMQRENIAKLDPHVSDKNQGAYVPQLDAFVLWGLSTNRGCPLEHKPPQQSRLLDENPNAVWLGGFTSDWCEASYDYAGRTITTYEFTFNGFRVPLPNLEKPRLSVAGNTMTVHFL
jgi:hypothetical protein